MRSFRRSSLWLVILMMSWISAGAAPADYGALMRQAQADWQNGDAVAFEMRIRSALSARPDYPPLLYNLAIARNAQRDPAAALQLLSRLADMGLSYDIAADADFGRLRESAAFRNIAARLEQNARPVVDGDTAYTLSDPGLVPEGITHDPADGSLIIGSIVQHRLIRITPDGKEKTLGTDDVLWSVFGMQLDPSRRVLWIATSAVPQTRDIAAPDVGRAAIVELDADTGALRRRFELPRDGRQHVLGDVLILPQGILTSDSLTGAVYLLDPASGVFHALVRPGLLVSPQGMAVLDAQHVLIADYRGGLYRVTLEDGAARRLDVPADACVYGIDGLYRHDDEFIAIQNGIPPARVVRIRLDTAATAVESVQILESALPEYAEPNLGVVLDHAFLYIANSQWNRFRPDGSLPPADLLARPRIRAIPLSPGP